MQAIKLKFTLVACLVAAAGLTAPVFAQDRLAVQSHSGLDTNGQPNASTATNRWSVLEQRLQPFLLSDNALTHYHAQKAHMWLTYAKNERSERSLSNAAQQAKAQAVQLIEQLEHTKDDAEQQQTISMTTPIIASSQVMRRDLWVNAEHLKHSKGFDCAPADIAQAEVMLVWAAAEHCELGWRHSRELFSAAERLIDQANYQASSCHGGTTLDLPTWNKASYPSLAQLNGKGCAGVVGTWPIVATHSAIRQPVVEPTNKSLITAQPESAALANVVHFAFNQATLSEASQQILTPIATVLRDHPDYSITLYGHTDARGSAAYNLNLGERRAQAVERFLMAQGVDSGRIATVAAGEKQLISDSILIQGYALSRRVALVYASADGEEIKTTSQATDLQPE